jgi:hypothetical protein
VAGQTVDEAGLPVAGATVKVYDLQSLFVTTSGPDGRFTVPGTPSQVSLSISATATLSGVRLRGISSVFPTGGDVTDAGEILLLPVDDVPDPLTTAIGTVVNPRGEPVGNAKVNVSTPYDVFSTTTAPDGTFSIPGVPTVDGDLSAGASAVLDGALHTGFSSGTTTPNPGGQTDLGTIFVVLDGQGGEKRGPAG